MATIHNCESLVYFEGPLAVDADGSPRAYHPDGRSGLDYLANAGRPGNWYGVVTDTGERTGKPVVQGPRDPFPGFYISPTSLANKAFPRTDPLRWVDSERVPYIALPPDARAYGLRLGQVAFVYCRRTGQACAAVVADTGPRGKWGEGSIALARALGLPSSPRSGGAASGVVYVVFKGSSQGWPRDNQDVALQVQELINSFGGVERFARATYKDQ